MKLHGQEQRERPAAGSESGYALAALLVALAVMAVTLTVAMPVWNTAAKREREEELVWRGTQYARAVALFRRKYANASPPNLDILLNERFLRRKYKDPMTKDGEFQLVYATDQRQVPGQPTQPSPKPPGQPQPSSALDPQSRVSAGARGGIVGVVSKSTDKSLRMFNGRTKYNEWAFTPDTVGLKMAAGGANAPGGAAGNIGAGGRPGTGGPMGPSRGQMTIDPFGRPTTSPRAPGQPGQPSTPAPRPFGLPPQRPPQ